MAAQERYAGKFAALGAGDLHREVAALILAQARQGVTDTVHLRDLALLALNIATFVDR